MMRRILLLTLLLALLCVTFTSAFNPYSDDDESGSGVTPETSTLTCTKDAKGVERCESVAKIVPDESELEQRVAEAEAERAALAEAKAAAKAERDAKYAAEREAKREKRKQEEDALRQEKEKKRPSQDDYKIKEPLKKLKVDYYKYFGVARDAPKLAIRKAANAAAVANHPDKCDTEQCRDNMVVINQARDVLLNDETREKYDFLLRYGFRVYDDSLYEDMYKQYLENPDEMPNGFDNRVHDPSSDYSSMNLSEEAAGWLLLITGLIATGMIGYPAYQFYEKRKDNGAKKVNAQKALLAAQQKAKKELEELLKSGKAKPGNKTGSVKKQAASEQ